MVKIFPLIFVLLWSSAFITTKPIIDNSDPFSALAFRFLVVAIGFFIFSIKDNFLLILSTISPIFSLFPIKSLFGTINATK